MPLVAAQHSRRFLQLITTPTRCPARCRALSGEREIDLMPTRPIETAPPCTPTLCVLIQPDVPSIHTIEALRLRCDNYVAKDCGDLIFVVVWTRVARYGRHSQPHLAPGRRWLAQSRRIGGDVSYIRRRRRQ